VKNNFLGFICNSSSGILTLNGVRNDFKNEGKEKRWNIYEEIAFSPNGGFILIMKGKIVTRQNCDV
jgi:hypothetical protein